MLALERAFQQWIVLHLPDAEVVCGAPIRVQPFVTNKRQGMGVGLSISRTIVEAHGGQIGASPNPAGGTTFRFTCGR